MTLVRTLISVAFVGALAACQSTVSVAPTTPRGALPTAKSFAPAVPSFGPYSNRALARDFLDLHFSLENGRTLDRFTRFEGPITVSIAGGHTPLADRELSQLLRTLRTQAGVPINYSNDQENANIVVEFVPASQLSRRAPNTACIVVPNVTRWDALNSTSRADLDWNTLETRSKIGIFLPSDVAPQELRDCLHEELAQALGPLNDLYRLEHSVYNDDNIHSVLSDYDLLILRATYAGELRSGMSREQVAQRIPTILARLNPRGQSLGPWPQALTFRGFPMPSAPRKLPRAMVGPMRARALAGFWWAGSPSALTPKRPQTPLTAQPRFMAHAPPPRPTAPMSRCNAPRCTWRRANMRRLMT